LFFPSFQTRFSTGQSFLYPSPFLSSPTPPIHLDMSSRTVFSTLLLFSYLKGGGSGEGTPLLIFQFFFYRCRVFLLSFYSLLMDWLYPPFLAPFSPFFSILRPLPFSNLGPPFVFIFTFFILLDTPVTLNSLDLPFFLSTLFFPFCVFAAFFPLSPLFNLLWRPGP